MHSSDSSVEMSLSGETASSDSGINMRRPADNHVSRHRTFQFIPKDLATKCRKLIESYHAIYGFVGLPDMLWLSDARDVIEYHEELTQLFKKASRSRGAKRANDLFLLITTTIVALEVLARDFANWGKHFPAAKREAEKVLGDIPSRKRTSLMDLYLFPPLGVRRELADALTPSSTPGGADLTWKRAPYASGRDNLLFYERNRFERRGRTERGDQAHRRIAGVCARLRTQHSNRSETAHW